LGVEKCAGKGKKESKGRGSWQRSDEGLDLGKGKGSRIERKIGEVIGELIQWDVRVPSSQMQRQEGSVTVSRGDSERTLMPGGRGVG